MIHILFCRSNDGHVVSTSTLQDDFNLAELSVPEGLSVVRVESALPPGTYRLTNGVIDAYTPTPDIEAEKATKWELMKLARSAALDAPMATPYGTFDCDAASRKNITDAVLMSQFATPFSIDYTLADNTTATLDAAAMANVGLLLAQKVQNAYAIGRTLRAAIEAAPTVEALEQITWPS